MQKFVHNYEEEANGETIESIKKNLNFKVFKENVQ